MRFTTLVSLLCCLMSGMLSPDAIAGESTITYSGEIAAIVYKKCGACHRSGGAGSFPLASYRDVVDHAPAMRAAVSRGDMPPWLPEGELGEFVGDPRLTLRERETLLRWLDGDLPEGDFTETPIAPAYARDWMLGSPHAVLQAQPFSADHLPKGSFYSVELPGEDAWINALEVRWTDARVRQALLWLELPLGAQSVEIQEGESVAKVKLRLPFNLRDRVPWLAASPLLPARRARALDARDRVLLGIWSCDEPARSLPPDMALRLPAGSRLNVELRPAAQGAREPVSIGLYFAQAEPKSLVTMVALQPRSLTSLGGTGDQPAVDAWYAPVDAELHSLAPHACDLARDVRVALTLPSGKTESLLWIPRWDTRWERTFTFTRPVQLPAGSRVDVRYSRAANSNREPLDSPLLGALVSPVRPDRYDELVRSIRLHQIDSARRTATSQLKLR